MEAVTVTGVSYRYPRRDRPALRDLDLRIEAGELVLLLGDSGSGKSTLLRAMLGLVPHFHGGQLSGRVVTEGMDTRDHRPGEIARRAGLVFQDPEAQMVMRTALREAGFGLENLGWPADDIAARAQEALMVTGASALAERPAEQLSGGEQQRLAIASVVSMGQRLLLLDEPTSQLDPVAAEELLGLVVRVNRDRGTTVVLAEHRTGRIFAEADRVIVMDAGQIVVDAPPAEAAAQLTRSAPWLLPPVAQAFVRARRPELPLTVRAARAAAPGVNARPAAAPRAAGEEVIRITGAHKRLGAIDALRGVDTAFGAGQTTVLMGENGAGKTTLAVAACGLLELDRGRVERSGRAGYVSQNPAHYLLHETVEEEVAYALANLGVDGDQRRKRVRAELERFDLGDRASGHPRDLSSGERQRLAIASVTVMRPQLLILDEPTRGVDGLRKLAVIELVRELSDSGTATVVVTHDMDFAAEVADVVTTMAAGRVLHDRGGRELLASRLFFVSQVGLAFGCVSVAEAAALLERSSPVAVHA
jgi:energy-coupling factor transporter ATP-binding protein EcfA2